MSKHEPSSSEIAMLRRENYRLQSELEQSLAVNNKSIQCTDYVVEQIEDLLSRRADHVELHEVATLRYCVAVLKSIDGVF